MANIQIADLAQVELSSLSISELASVGGLTGYYLPYYNNFKITYPGQVLLINGRLFVPSPIPAGWRRIR
jgi:hypothetical protein